MREVPDVDEGVGLGHGARIDRRAWELRTWCKSAVEQEEEMAKMTDDQLRTLAANARANDVNVEKWLDRDRSLALIEDVLELRAALKEALDGWADDPAIRVDPDCAEALRIAELRKLVGE